MKSIPFILVTGFLGSGKTTLLKRFLNRYADEKRIAVIQNEFAPANIDGHELKETGKTFEIVEINKGSVFCVCQLSNFVQSLIDVTDAYQPDVVILEATGLADPIAIGQLLGTPELNARLYLSYVWCVIDAVSFLEMEQQVQRMVHQVRVADTVIINKVDLAAVERLIQIEKRIAELNTGADQIKVSHCDLSYEDLFKAISSHPQSMGQKKTPDNPQSAGAPAVSSAVLRTTKRIAKDKLINFLQQYEQKAYRIKGHVNLADQTTVGVQFCFGQSEIRTIEKEPGPTELIALGPEIIQDEFGKRFTELIV